jgi:hypothetical protein
MPIVVIFPFTTGGDYKEPVAEKIPGYRLHPVATQHQLVRLTVSTMVVVIMAIFVIGSIAIPMSLIEMMAAFTMFPAFRDPTVPGSAFDKVTASPHILTMEYSQNPGAHIKPTGATGIAS